MHVNTLIVGGGAAGFFTAVNRAEQYPDESIPILERGKRVLDKVRISGGGRCNVTHACWDPAELVQYYPRGGRELLGPFHHFACGDTVGWFEDRGVALKIEEDGRMFPTTDDSETIIACLTRRARELGVGLRTGAKLTFLSAPAAPPEKWTVRTADGQTYAADRLVIASGSNPQVWKLLAELGHTIVEPVPSLFAFNVRDPRLAGLAGISVPWANLSIGGTKLIADGPLLITHRGLSGPAVLRLSAWGARDLHPLTYDFDLHVNWVAQRAEDVRTTLSELRQRDGRRQVLKRPPLGLATRLWQQLGGTPIAIGGAGVREDQKWAEVTNEQLDRLARQLTDGRYRVRGKATNKDEFTTAGGVDLREVNFKDFSSRLHDNLYFAGEVLDIDAITGGFNFQAAWTGGYLIARG